MKTSPIHKLFSRLSFLLLLIFIGCDEQTSPTELVNVNPDFELNPPVPQDIKLSKFENGEATLEIRFATDIRMARVHAMQLTSGKVILNDDGKSEDQHADDGIYTVKIKTNEDEYRRFTSILNDPQLFKDDNRTYFVRREYFDKQTPRPQTHLPEHAGDFTGFFEIQNLLEETCKNNYTVDASKSLLITSLSVVEDPSRTYLACNALGTPGSVWTFENLMNNIANESVTGVSAVDMVRNWLDSWLTSNVVNGDPIPTVPEMFDGRSGFSPGVIKPWLVESGTPASNVNLNNWKQLPLDLSKAPFRLKAIVNRSDLHGNFSYGMTTGGQLSFVFEVIDPAVCEAGPTHGAGSMNFIFEFAVPVSNCEDFRNYVKQWYDLKNFDFNDNAYKSSLQSLTERCIRAGAMPNRINGSALNCIRIDGNAITPTFQFREYTLAANHMLQPTTLKQTPASIYSINGPMQHRLADWLMANYEDVVENTHAIPDKLPTGEDLLGAYSHGGINGWQVNSQSGPIDEELRHHFSLNTCSGCHGDETTQVQAHLFYASPGEESRLSSFLTGNTQTIYGIERSYNDLERRRRDMQYLLCASCQSSLAEFVFNLYYRPASRVH